MSLPNAAAVRVNWVPVSCMPSPESPAKRIVTRSSSCVCGSISRVVVTGASTPFGPTHRLVRAGWQVEELLGERLGEVLEDLLRPDDALEVVVVVQQRDVPVAAGLHQLDRAADGLLEVEVVRLRRHQRLDGLGQVDRRDIATDETAEDVSLRQDAEEAALGVDDEYGIARAGSADRGEAV